MLGYDRDLLAGLGAALVVAADALDAVASAETDAQPALGVAATAAESFRARAQWTVDLLACNVLDGYAPTSPERTDIDLALFYVLVNGYGWSATIDSTGDAYSASAVAEASALGRVLSMGLPQFESAEDRAKLAAHLQAAVADPAALAALRANLDAESLAALVELLVLQQSEQRRHDGVPYSMARNAPSPEVAQIDAMLAALATVAYDPAAPLQQIQATLGRMRPYTAVTFLTQIKASESDLATLAIDAFTRYGAGGDAGPRLGEYPDEFSPGIGQLLFPRITAMSPAAANRFAAAIASVDPELLIATVNDAAVSQALLQRATDAAAVSEADAGQVIVPVVDYLRLRPAEHELPFSNTSFDVTDALTTGLGTVLAPWMYTLVRDREGGAFTWDDTARDQTIVFVLADDQARADLMAAVDGWLDSLPLREPAQDYSEVAARLAEIAGALGVLLGLAAINARNQAEAALAQWSLMTSSFARALSIPIGFVPVVGSALRVGLNAFALASDHGVVPGRPRSVEAALIDALDDADGVLMMASYLSMSVMRAYLIDTSAIDADTEEVPSPDEVGATSASEYDAAMENWVTAEVRLEFRAEINDARKNFTSPAQSAVHDTIVTFRDG